ncbi:hypothetical protein M3Y97_00217800 [Aphelenchoides bicaudatus]|nr:hypothetical protein M3Y97_00217800 [Aphelenchoides bicaudatus]
MAASTISASAAPCFYLFKSPLVVSPSYEIWRSISNVLSKYYYAHFYESDFSDKAFQRGAKLGIFSCADAIHRNDQERLNYLLTSNSLQYIKKRIGELPPELINSKLSFKEDNIVSMFAHSNLLSTEKFLGIGERARPTFYSTMVAFIDKDSTKPISSAEARKRANELLVCNITFARVLTPLGRWQISDLNFFDGRAVRYL